MEISRSSFSQYSAFLTCPRKYYLGYVLNLTSIEEAGYLTDGKDFARGVAGQTPEDRPLTKWEQIGLLARAHYPRKPGEAAEVKKVIKIAGQEVTMVADALCDNAIIEYKTTGRPDVNTIASQALSNQLQLYAHAFDKRIILLRLVKKPAIRQRKDETEEMFDQRYINEFVEKASDHFLEVEVPIDTSKAIDEFIMVQKLINACKMGGIWPAAAPYNCYSLTPCTFLKYCSDPTTNAILYKIKERKEP